MEIRDLKNKIEGKESIILPLILKAGDNDYLCKQYVAAICENVGSEKIYIDALSDIPSDDIFGADTSIYVYQVDALQDYISPEQKNLIVICNDIKTNQDADITDMSMKVLQWQLADYIKMRVPGLKKDEADWLAEVTGLNPYRIDQECKKLELFPKSMQEIIFNEINSENGYGDLTTKTIFDYTAAIKEKNLAALGAILCDLKTIDVEGTGAVTLLLRDFKIMAEAVTANHWREGMKCTEKQFWYFKKNCRFTATQIINIYDFLTGIDARLKSGELTFKSAVNHLTENNAFVDYLTVNLVILGNC